MEANLNTAMRLIRVVSSTSKPLHSRILPRMLLRKSQQKYFQNRKDMLQLPTFYILAILLSSQYFPWHESNWIDPTKNQLQPYVQATNHDYRFMSTDTSNSQFWILRGFRNIFSNVIDLETLINNLVNQELLTLKNHRSDRVKCFKETVKANVKTVKCVKETVKAKVKTVVSGTLFQKQITLISSQIT